MKRKVLVLLAAVVSTVAASGVYGQFGFGPIKRPNIANIFHPVVGAGAACGRCFEVATRYGRKIRVTGDHSLFVEGSSGDPVARKVEELRPGDRVAQGCGPGSQQRVQDRRSPRQVRNTA